jgi:hypothetical protein
VIGILPGRLATRQRLFVGAMLIIGVSFLELIPVELGPFGSPWPIALLWPVCGWSGLGPNVTTAGLLFLLGLWVDMLTGAQFGTWSLIALSSHALVLVLAPFLGTRNFGRISRASLTGLVFLVMMLLFSLWRNTGFNIVSSLLPLIIAIITYRSVGKLFDLSEDEI